MISLLLYISAVAMEQWNLCFSAKNGTLVMTGLGEAGGRRSSTAAYFRNYFCDLFEVPVWYVNSPTSVLGGGDGGQSSVM